MGSTVDPRHEIRLFLVLLLIFSAPFYGFYSFGVNVFPDDMPPVSTLVAAAFMWAPGVAALTTRFLLHRNFRGLGWGWGRTHVYLWAVLVLPFLLALGVYAAVWTFEPGSFRQKALDSALEWLQQAGALGFFQFVLVWVVAVLGEELGWRGLLTPELAKITSFTKTSLLTGLVWALWHVPFISLAIVYYWSQLPVWYALLCFTTTVLGLSFFFTWLRFHSQSVWPAAFLHASCDGAQYLLEGLTGKTARTEHITFQYGAGFALVTWLCVGLFWKRLRARF